MTLSLVAVFIPVLFLGGLIGRLFREFAVTISAAILVSALVSLTLTPMLCSRFLRPGSTAEHGRFYEATERIYQSVLAAYRRSLGWVMDRRGLAMGVSAPAPRRHRVARGGGAQGVHPQRGPEPAPGHDRGRRRDQLRRDEALPAADQRGGGGRLQHRRLHGVHGGRWALRQPVAADHAAQAGQRAVARRRRGRSGAAGQAGRIPGIRVFVQNPPPINIGGRQTKSSLPVHPAGLRHQSAVLPALQALEARLRELPELRNVTTDLLIRNPQIRVAIDRERASAFGVTPAQVEGALYTAYGAAQASTIYTATNQYAVVIELLPEFQRDLSAMRLLSVRGSGGHPGPAHGAGHRDRGPRAAVGEPFGPAALGDALASTRRPGSRSARRWRRSRRRRRTALPVGHHRELQRHGPGLPGRRSAACCMLLVLAILVIYLVLGILYESFIHPLTILSGLPFAGFGALLVLWAAGLDLSVYAFVGIIMLVGLVKKNAIMMIDFALEAERRDGKPPARGDPRGLLVRFRPIMMTTMAALMGTLPIALGVGAGAESRRPLGVAVVGGLAFSQLITLYVTPVVYTLLDELRHRSDAGAGGRSGPGHRELTRRPDAGHISGPHRPARSDGRLTSKSLNSKLLDVVLRVAFRAASGVYCSVRRPAFPAPCSTPSTDTHDRPEFPRADPPAPHRRRDAAVVHQLLDERHRVARPARRARRTQAGAPAHPLRDERARAGARPAVQEVGDGGGRRARQVPPARRPLGVRRAGPHGPGLLAALPAGGRPGQLRLGRRRPGGGLPLHRGAADRASR